MTRLSFLLGAAAVVLSGCMGGADTASSTAASVGVDKISVTLAENASYGLLQAEQDPKLAQAFAATLDQELKQDVLTGSSGNSATVLVEAITVQTGASRTIAAAESSVRGDVVVTNSAGQEIARFDDVSFKNKTNRNTSTVNGIPVGALLSIASNSTNASPEKQIAQLADGFSKTIAARLGR